MKLESCANCIIAGRKETIDLTIEHFHVHNAHSNQRLNQSSRLKIKSQNQIKSGLNIINHIFKLINHDFKFLVTGEISSPVVLVTFIFRPLNDICYRLGFKARLNTIQNHKAYESVRERMLSFVWNFDLKFDLITIKLGPKLSSYEFRTQVPSQVSFEVNLRLKIPTLQSLKFQIKKW